MPPTVKSVDEALQRDHLYIKVVEVHFPGFFFCFTKGEMAMMMMIMTIKILIKTNQCISLS